MSTGTNASAPVLPIVPVVTQDPSDKTIAAWILLSADGATFQLCVRGPRGILRK